MNPTTGSPVVSKDAELFLFEPDGQRARFLDQRMRADLADSFRYIFRQANGQLAVPEKPLEDFLKRLVAGRVSPLAFSHYCDAVLAIEANELDEATALLNGMLRLPAAADTTSINDLADPATSEAARRFVRFIDTDLNVRLDIFPPAEFESKNCRNLIREALDLMAVSDPAQLAEIYGLVTEIVLASGDKNPKAMTFDGASSFMLWGGIIINAGRGSNPLAMAQMLTHEATHVLLFGLGAEAALVENSDDELFPSPLRRDLRPMDGIYHATFVTARMHRVVKRLLDGGKLSAAQADFARKELADNTRLFEKGYDVVQRHGKLSLSGRELMAGAASYMKANA